MLRASDDAEIRRRLAERQALVDAAEVERIRAEIAAEREADERLADAREQVEQPRQRAVADRTRAAGNPAGR